MQRAYLFVVAAFAALGPMLFFTGGNAGWVFVVWMAGRGAVVVGDASVRAGAAVKGSPDEPFGPDCRDRRG